MRVPPDLVGRRPAWHLPAALIVLTMAVLVAGIAVSTDENRAVATQSNRITKLQVVVTRYPLTPGKVITAADLVLQVRPIDGLPEGAITRPEEIIGKVSQAIMPQGAVVTLGSFVGGKNSEEPDGDPPRSSPRTSPHAPEASAPTAPLAEEDHPTSHAPERVTEPEVRVSRLPERGTHTPVVAEQSPATARVHAPPLPAVSPPASTAMIRPKVSPVIKARERKQPPASARRRFRSYAWVAGDPYSYGIGSDGELQVVDPGGAVVPLDGYRAREDELSDGDTPDHTESGEAR